jgi:hypothetical protein
MSVDSMSSSTGDLQGVARRLDSLEAQVSESIRGSRTRNSITIAFALVAVVLVGFWLYYAHLKFSSQVNPDLAADLVQGYIQDNLPGATAQLESSLRQNAPSVINEGEKQLRALPGHLETQFHQQAQRALDEEMPALQARLYTTLKEGLAEARAVGKDAAPDKDDEARFRALAQSLATLYGTESTKLVDDVNSQYTKASGDIVNGLNLLAEGKNLTPQQKTQRNLVRDFLILARDSGGAQGVALPTAK